MGGIIGLLPILQVARIAARGKSEENSHGGLLVARLTRDSCVRTKQRETILVIFHLLRGGFPAVYGVALRAVGAHLAAVNVGVAIGAVLSDVPKNWLQVALRTLHFFVHTAQRISRSVVIELRNGADRLPPSGGVTVFTRDG